MQSASQKQGIAEAVDMSSGLPTKMVMCAAVGLVFLQGGRAVAQDLSVEEVQFESEPVGVTFYQQSDLIVTTVVPKLGPVVGVVYKPICTAPCKAMLPVGTHTLAMSYEGSPPQEAAPVQIAKGTTRLHGDYVSRSDERVAGVAVFFGGFVTGAVVAGIGFAQTKKQCLANFPCENVPDPDSGMVSAGLGITLVGVGIAGYLILQHDDVDLIVPPPDATPRAPGGRGTQAADNRCAIRLENTAKPKCEPVELFLEILNNQEQNQSRPQRKSAAQDKGKCLSSARLVDSRRGRRPRHPTAAIVAAEGRGRCC